jgi:pSer/pThr/pTyr-binding forkhead associated (FHA) protein
MPRLIIEAGKQIGSEFAVRDRMRLGRLDTCEARLDDDNASREHAAVRFVKGRFYVIDLQSRNGTIVNGKRVAQAPLVPGDRIQIGDTVLLFHDDEHDSRPSDTLGADELKRATDEADAIDEAEAASTPRAGSPGEAARSAVASPARPADASGEGAIAANRDAIDASLFALLLVLTFLCASYATQIVLRLFVS